MDTERTNCREVSCQSGFDEVDTENGAGMVVGGEGITKTKYRPVVSQ
jgi:hypothetical protein